MVEVEEVESGAAEEKTDDDKPKEKTRAELRAEWVRGFSHVLPIDAEKANWKGPVDKLESLLTDDGLDPNERDQAFNLTPLMKAAARDHVEAIKVLLKHGADVHLKDNMGYTALHKCSGKPYCDYPECRAVLLAAGAKDEPHPPKRHFIYDPPDNSRWIEWGDPDWPHDFYEGLEVAQAAARGEEVPLLSEEWNKPLPGKDDDKTATAEKK